MHQAADIYAAVLASGDRVTHSLAPARHVWAQIANGALVLNGQRPGEGDDAAISGEAMLTISSDAGGEILLVDLG